MHVHATGDIVDGILIGDGGIPVPDNIASLPLDRLRYANGVVVDVGERTSFFVDDRTGSRHVEPGEGRHQVACRWNDRLVRDDAGWRLRTSGDDVVPSAPITVTRKSDLFRRCSDDEADRIEAALGQTSTRMRRLFDSVTEFRSDAEEYALLHGTAVDLFGEARAAELLAPSA